MRGHFIKRRVLFILRLQHRVRVDTPKITEIKEGHLGKQIIKGKNRRKELAPNVRYITEDGYKYTTDELGRIVDVEEKN